MKNIYLTALGAALLFVNSSYAQYVTVDANDVLNSNTKLVAATTVGQSFFTGHQLGWGYANTQGIFRAITDQFNGSVNYFADGLKSDGAGSFLTTYSVRADGQGFFAGGVNIGGSAYGLAQPASAKLEVFNNSSNATNLILSADYNNAYRWRFNTIDRGNAIDMDITASNNSDQQESILKLAASFSGRPSFVLMNNWMVANNGNIGIGTTDNANWQLASSAYRLAVGGKILTEGVTVKLQSAWPDYVFKPSYNLMPLSEIKTYIDLNHHLPEMPSEKEVADKGVDLGEMNKLLTKKVEELTLYLVEKEAKQKDLEKAISIQQLVNKSLEKRLEKLENKQR